MATRRRIEITVETEQVTMGRGETENGAAWCAMCCAHVLMIGVEQAARMARSSVRQLVRRVDAGELHCLEPPDGRLLICLASLSRWLRRTREITLPLPLLEALSENTKKGDNS